MTMSNNRKSIELTFPAEKVTEAQGRHSIPHYVVELPHIVCNEKEDAEFIQTQTNEFITKLCRSIVK